MKLAALVKGPQQLRGNDDWGSGAFEAPRGERRHRGIDIVTKPGQDLYCPMDGTILRVAEPYEDEPRFNGLLLAGSGKWEGLEMKLFYLDGFDLGPISQAAHLATAQDIGLRYPGITNHVHVELRQKEKLLDPTPFFDLAPDFT